MHIYVNKQARVFCREAHFRYISLCANKPQSKIAKIQNPKTLFNKAKFDSLSFDYGNGSTDNYGGYCTE